MQRAERERVGKQKTKALKIDTNGCFLEEKIVPSIRWNRAQERLPSAHSTFPVEVEGVEGWEKQKISSESTNL